MDQLPEVGEVYWVDTSIYADGDSKPFRPLVVVRAPASRLDLVHVITRSSKTRRFSGVPHPADPSLGLNEEGVFAIKHLRHIEAARFVSPAVERRGMLPEPYLGDVLSMWENS